MSTTHPPTPCLTVAHSNHLFFLSTLYSCTHPPTQKHRAEDGQTAYYKRAVKYLEEFRAAHLQAERSVSSLPTHPPTSSSTHLLIYPTTRPPLHPSIHPPTHPPTYQSIHPPTHLLIHPSTHPLTHPLSPIVRRTSSTPSSTRSRWAREKEEEEEETRFGRR